MSKVIIFGVQDFAELAWFYLTYDSNHDVVAFTVSKEFLPKKGRFCGLPIVEFDEIEKTFATDSYKMFAPMSPKKMNKIRTDVYTQIKEKGYKLISYVSSKATVFSNKIGENCFILEDNTIQPFTTIGNNVILWSGNHIGHHGKIEDHVTFTSHVVMSGHCIIESFSFLGVNATLRDGITVGEGSLIAMDASVTRNTEPWTVNIGIPASQKQGVKSFEVL